MSRYGRFRDLSETEVAALQAKLRGEPVGPPAQAPKRQKYRHRPTAGYGSRHESDTIAALRWRESRGEITALVTDKRLLRYALVVNGKFICYYEADASWLTPDGQRVVADAKSAATRRDPVYAIKIKLMAACHNIYVVELL